MKFYKPNFWKAKYYNIYSLILLPISIIIQFLYFIQKRIMTPKEAFKNGSDWLVIGRPITKGNIKKNIQKLIKELN